MRTAESTTSGLCLPTGSAFRVWVPSWRFSPRRPLPAVFQVGSAPGIRPLKPSPPDGCLGIPAALTHMPLTDLTSRLPEGKRRWDRYRLLGFTPARSPLRLGRAVKPGRRRMLLWASPLQGSEPHGLSRPSPPLLSRAYQPGRRWPAEPITPQSVNRRTAFQALADLAPLLGFCTSSCSTVQTTNDPGYVFTSPATAIAGGLTDSLGRRGLTGVDRTDDRCRAKASFQPPSLAA